MKHLLISIKLTVATLLLFGVVYPLVICGIATLTGTSQGNMDLVGQSFTSAEYFNGRPSAVNYNAAAAGASNKGPTDAEYLAEVERRINELLNRNPGVKRSELPVDIITASGSGLDPHISPQAAYIQVARIATARNASPEAIRQLVDKNIEYPVLGVFGPMRVNVLNLNRALDGLK